MQVIAFDTAAVPAHQRLDVFRAGAPEFQIDPLGDPAAFGGSWRMVTLGELNALHVRFSSVRYRRDLAAIAADGTDRFTLHYYYRGGERGVINGRPVECGPGGAMMWDLTQPQDLRSLDDHSGSESLIVTLPRLLVTEVLPGPVPSGPLQPSAALSLAAEQVRHVIDHAHEVPDAAAVFLGRALRDMLAVAMLGARETHGAAEAHDAPLLQRVVDLLDRDVSSEWDAAAVAHQLGTSSEKVVGAVVHLGGLGRVMERRRLLAAYRLLRDPQGVETVGEIAHRCGFTDLPSFSRQFRSAFHTSARDLRLLGGGRLPRWAGAYHVEKLYGSLITS